MIPKISAPIATFFLRIPLSAMFMQQGLSKLPVDGAVAEAWGLPYIVWWFVTWGEIGAAIGLIAGGLLGCLLYTSPSPRDRSLSRMPSSA